MMQSSKNVDISQLQREYRNMENNRKTYADESQQLLRRQQQMIDKLKRENEKLHSEIALETKHTTKGTATVQQTQVLKLQDQVDAFSRKMGVETKKLETIKQQMNMMRHKVMHQKKHLGGVNASKENHEMINKQIRILENRLDKALVKFNEALASNKELRDTIDNLRRERVVFDNIYRKLERELLEKKKQMAQIIEQSNLSYEQRDAAQMEVVAIDQMNRTEREDYDQKMKDMNDKIEAHKRIHEMEEATNSGEAVENNVRDELGLERQQQALANAQLSVERVENFEQAFNKIKEATGITDIDELVSNFIQHEDQNFSLFNYVNEQANEIEKLEEQLGELRNEELKYSQESGDDVNQHKQLLKDLEQRLYSTEASAEKYEAKSLEAQKNLNSLKAGIQSIFTKLDCNSMLGDGVVTEVNLMQCLGVIEQRTNEILQRYAKLKDHEQPTDVVRSNSQMQLILGIGPSTPMGHEQIQIKPPNLEDYSSSDEDLDDEEDDMRPLTRDELKIRTLKGLQKKGKQ